MVTGGYSGIAVIDTDPTSANFNKEIARIIVPLGVQDVAVSGSSLYVTSGDGRTVTVINTAAKALTGIFTTDQTSSGGRAIYPPERVVPPLQHRGLHPVHHDGPERHGLHHGLHRRSDVRGRRGQPIGLSATAQRRRRAVSIHIAASTPSASRAR